MSRGVSPAFSGTCSWHSDLQLGAWSGATVTPLTPGGQVTYSAFGKACLPKRTLRHCRTCQITWSSDGYAGLPFLQ
jgi:hypothetical protein